MNVIQPPLVQGLLNSTLMARQYLPGDGPFISGVRKRASAILQPDHTKRYVSKGRVKIAQKGNVAHHFAEGVHLSAQTTFRQYPREHGRP